MNSQKQINEYNEGNNYHPGDRDFWTMKKELICKLWIYPLCDFKSKIRRIGLFLFNHKGWNGRKIEHKKAVDFLNNL